MERKKSLLDRLMDEEKDFLLGSVVVSVPVAGSVVSFLSRFVSCTLVADPLAVELVGPVDEEVEVCATTDSPKALKKSLFLLSDSFFALKEYGKIEYIGNSIELT